jgi:light-regulated signal transduction histidine kinase (bacteriophytochrome)
MEELRLRQDELIQVNAELEETNRGVMALYTELEDKAKELKLSNSELESFSYSISHDLRAPLRAIDGFSQMVIEDAAERLDADDVEHLRHVRTAAQRMAVLIDHLLGLSRASRQTMSLGEVDVSATAREVLAELREAQPERQVETVVAPGLRALADKVLLRAILTNLLSNAWKFTARHETARIEVGVTDSSGEPAFFVRDDGAGFDMRFAGHLFGAFQRMHEPEKFEGDGIGLATTHRLVSRHGGRIWAESEVEKGATFYFSLPQPKEP